MCGIVGVAVADGRDLRPMLERMTATITHRGPDDDGFYEDRGAGVGLAMGRSRVPHNVGQRLLNDPERSLINCHRQ